MLHYPRQRPKCLTNDRRVRVISLYGMTTSRCCACKVQMRIMLTSISAGGKRYFHFQETEPLAAERRDLTEFREALLRPAIYVRNHTPKRRQRARTSHCRELVKIRIATDPSSCFPIREPRIASTVSMAHPGGCAPWPVVSQKRNGIRRYASSANFSVRSDRTYRRMTRIRSSQVLILWSHLFIIHPPTDCPFPRSRAAVGRPNWVSGKGMLPFASDAHRLQNKVIRYLFANNGII